MKTKFKYLIVIFLSLLTICILQNKAYAVNITREYLQNKFNEIRNMSGYRNGEKYMWNDDGWYSDYCSQGHAGWECHAYGINLFDWLFNQCAMCSITGNTDVNSLYVGDMVRVDGNTHTIIIQDIVGNDIWYTDANWNYSKNVRWDVHTTKGELAPRITYISHASGNNVKTLAGNSDTEAPRFLEAFVDMSGIVENMCLIKAKATDNVGVTNVRFAIWTEFNYQSDIKWIDGNYNSSSGYWEALLNIADFGNKKTMYRVHMYAYDAAGNNTPKVLSDFAMGTTKTNLGDFTARIVLKSNSNYVLGVKEKALSSPVQLKTKSQSDSSQLWNFKRNSDETYTITNVSTGYVLHIVSGSSENYAQVIIYTSKNNVAQKYYMMSYNGGYRLVPTCTVDLKGISVKNDVISNGTDIELLESINLSNNSQTFVFEKVATSLSLNNTSVNLKVGEKSQLTETIYPTDATNKNISWSTTSSAVADVNSSGLITAKGTGTATITAKTTDGSNLSKTCVVTVTKENTPVVPPTVKPSVSYITHIQNYGWRNYVKDGQTSGTVGEGLRLEGIKIKLENCSSGGIEYRTHIQNIGWEKTYKSNDAFSGTEKQGLRLEAIQIRLTGEVSQKYDVYYRVHAENVGWLDWAKNGQTAGTQGYGYRLEGIEILLVSKNENAPGKTTKPYMIKKEVLENYKKGDYNNDGIINSKDISYFLDVKNNPSAKDILIFDMDADDVLTDNDYNILNNFYMKGAPTIEYITHIQNHGWRNYVKNGERSGTVGEGLRLEGIKIRLTSPISGGIQYRTHIENIGWEKTYKSSDEFSGTEGQGLRLEAIQIRLTGNMEKLYDIYYRVHAENVGWLDWAKNGQEAGTAKYGFRLEAIEIKLVEKGNSAPGKTDRPFMENK